MYNLINEKNNINNKINSKKRNGLLPYFVMIIIIFLIINIIAYHKVVLNKNLAELTDTDTYMRLVRVEQLAETGNWYDSVIHRSNYPYGDELHWTRLLDMILLAGAYLITPFQGFDKGLLTFGIIISPLLGICCILALLRVTESVINKNAQRLLMLIFIAQPILLQVFLMGRPDHHGLIILLFVLMLGCLYKIAEQSKNNNYVLFCGFIAALSLWVSIENIFVVIMVFITVGILWLIHGEDYAHKLLRFSLSTFCFCIFFLLIERPLSTLFVIEYDKISIVHIFVLMLSVIATYFLTLIKSKALFNKIIKLTLILIYLGLVLWVIFPVFYQGPMAEVNKAIYPIWLNKVSETQSLWTTELSNRIIIIGQTSLFVMYLIYLVASKRFQSQLTFLLPLICGFVIFLPLTVYMIRMSYYFEIIIILLLAVFLDDIIAQINLLKKRDLTKSLIRVLVIIIFVLGLPGLGIFLNALSNNSLENDTKIPDIKELSTYLNNYQINHPDAKTILTLLDFGPELLYRTNYNTISTPYHRNDQGILFNYEVMAAESTEQVQKMLKERSVDLLILCPKSVEKLFYKKTTENSTFYEQLISGKKPAYLEEVDLSNELKDSFIVYQIID